MSRDRTSDERIKWGEGRLLAGILMELEDFFASVVAKAITQVSEMQGLISDTVLRTIRVDASTHAIKTIVYGHSELHSGSLFSAKGYQKNIAVNDTVEFVVTVPDSDKEPHMTFSFSFTLGGTLDIYEGTTTVAGGTSVTPINNNRRSSNTSILSIVKDPASIGGNGNFLEGHLAGGNRQAGDSARTDELILKRNTKYLFRFTSSANSNSLDYNGSWYEHTPKD